MLAAHHVLLFGVVITRLNQLRRHALHMLRRRIKLLLLHLIGILSLVSYIVLCRQILIVADNLDLLLWPATCGSGSAAAVMDFGSLLARGLGVRGRADGHAALEDPLLVVGRVVHATRAHAAHAASHASAARGVAAFAPLTLIVTVLRARLRLEMLPSHLLSRHLILRTTSLIDMRAPAARSVHLLASTAGISMVLLPFVLAAALNRNSRLGLHFKLFN